MDPFPKCSSKEHTRGKRKRLRASWENSHESSRSSRTRLLASATIQDMLRLRHLRILELVQECKQFPVHACGFRHKVEPDVQGRSFQPGPHEFEKVVVCSAVHLFFLWVLVCFNSSIPSTYAIVISLGRVLGIRDPICQKLLRPDINPLRFVLNSSSRVVRSQSAPHSQ